MKKILAMALAAVAASTAVAGAQRVHEVPRRPALWAGADTNSAGAYYLHGVQRRSASPPSPRRRSTGPSAFLRGGRTRCTGATWRC